MSFASSQSNQGSGGLGNGPPKPMPRAPRWDSSLAFARDPYRFIGSTCDALQSDVFETRLLLSKAICLRGAEGAELLYDESRFTRAGGAPRGLKLALFGKGTVHGLEGSALAHRKQMFLSLMTREGVRDLVDLTRAWWMTEIDRLPRGNRVVLYEQLQTVLCRAVCEWADVRVPEQDFAAWTRDVSMLFDQAGAIGLGHLRARRARRRTHSCVRNYIEDIRSGYLHPQPGSAAWVTAWHRELDGELLTADVAADELLNVIRPTVAVSAYLTLAAMAVHEHSDVRERLQSGDAEYTALFAQEVRRFYPFFPAIPAVVRESFTWQGYRLERGTRVLLDVYGTNHDPRVWFDPQRFRPERFVDAAVTPFSFIPQGGGDAATGHRCPGELIATELLKFAGEFLARDVAYDVPVQDLSVDFSRMPALPGDKFVVQNMRLRATQMSNLGADDSALPAEAASPRGS